ncbi:MULTISPECIES: alternative ribosome rescue aminoacyl-tRNA hydrolase ArfB [Prochlorococcus]|uniref:Protein chain release factor B n=1 Tax=Prochlorococcus marinus (strain SARG / CCMP1375 / SS120) TaxID=167539 RepID=Q7VB73_PROMA|nr:MULTISPECIES: alternative ribosome rescue aminoacyl-tRNA hydrolase ArfB [Prochlorococcus]AAQ00270.1 Protein chain release factor B [Prochlorococcus marinus subsp. marinus str. CCMP1375]KGG14078.1 hypothetical protein EV04_0563 [Prochlorococcus marinus str. LG]KGG20754.1 hypothetical protein EV08_0958 [Prochlorococcus marinus str. SS2]KGG25155.1 hypothetical protein EV09_0049 [Prochlorococcus marinus str. SS35]KGG33293.1 hypothetical protein EV10_0500 [Prochlorococcus marinus str. SS51]
MDLYIKSNLTIPGNELCWRFSRSSGAGGQNINKTESRVEVIFNIQASKVLSTFQKDRISEHLKTKLINGSIHIAVQERRTQYQNRQLALTRLATLIKYGLKPFAKIRRATKPTKSSQKKRVALKKQRGKIKKNRQKGSASYDE